MPFDVEGALAAGYSKQEIADHLAQQNKFDVAGARKSGYSDDEIIQHLSSAPTAEAPTGGLLDKVGQVVSAAADIPGTLPYAAKKLFGSEPASVMEGFDPGPARSDSPAAPVNREMYTQFEQVARYRPELAGQIAQRKDWRGAAMRDVLARNEAEQARLLRADNLVSRTPQEVSADLTDHTASIEPMTGDNPKLEYNRKSGAGKRLQELTSGVQQGAEGLLQGGAGVAQLGARLSGLEGAADSAQTVQDASVRRSTDLALPENTDYLAKMVQGTYASITQNLPGLLTGAEVPALLTMGATSFGQELGNGRAAGLSDQDALKRASIYAAAEVLGEKLSIGPLLKTWKAAAEGVPVGQLAHSLGEFLKKEAIGEQFTTAVEFGTDKFAGFGLNKEASLDDYVQAVSDTFVQTALQTGLMGLGAGGLSKGAQTAKRLREMASPDAALAREIDSSRWDPNAVDAVARAALDPSNAQLARNDAPAQPPQGVPDAAATVAPVDAAGDQRGGDLGGGSPGDAPAVPGEQGGSGADAGAPVAGVRADSPVGDPGGSGNALTAPPGDPLDTALAELEQRVAEHTSAPAAAVAPQASPAAAEYNWNPLPAGAPVAPAVAASAQRAGVAAPTPAPYRAEKKDLANVLRIARAELGTDATLGRDVRLVPPDALPDTDSGNAMGRGTANFLAALYGAVGLRTFFFESPSGRVTTEGAIVQSSPDTVYQNVSAGIRRDALNVHEVGHVISALDPQTYQAFAQGVASAIDTSDAGMADYAAEYLGLSKAEVEAVGGNLDALLARYQETRGQGVSRSRLLEELHSDLLGFASTRPGFWQRAFLEIGRRDIGALRKIHRVLQMATQHVKAQLTAGGEFEAAQRRIKDLETVTREAARALGRFAGNRSVSQAHLSGGAVLQSPQRVGPLRSEAAAQTTATFLASKNGTAMRVVRGADGQFYVEQDTDGQQQGSGQQRTDRGQDQPGRAEGVSAPAGQDGREPAQAMGPLPRYGEPREHAVSVIGTHYSRAERGHLSGAFYGSGLPGAEAGRLQDADPELRHRIYFYVDIGRGVRPEEGVGGYAHEVELANIYDAAADPLNLKSRDLNAFELAVVRAGFDGWLSRDFGSGQGAVVLLGSKHAAVPVTLVGQGSRAPSGRALPAPRLSAEKQVAQRLVQAKGLPAGQMEARRWGRLLEAVEPELFAELDKQGLFDSEEVMYKDEIAGEYLRRTRGQGGAPTSPGVKASPARVMFEVAPDPNDKALKKQWDALPAGTKFAVSLRVAGKIMPRVFELARVRAQLAPQFGGYLDDTNPSFAAVVPDGTGGRRLLEVAHLAGFGLAQDSMMAISETPFAGSVPTGVITITLPESVNAGDIHAVHGVYARVRAVAPDRIQGHSTVGREMVLAVEAGREKDLADRIEAVLGDEFIVDDTGMHLAFPDKKEYDYENARQRPELLERREEAHRLRREATELVAAEVRRAQWRTRADARRAAGEAGRSDDGEVEASPARYAPPQQPQVSFTIPGAPQGIAAKLLDKVTYSYQDRFTDLRAVRDAIAAQGRTIRDEFDPYLAETLMHGKAAYRVQRFLEDEVEPITKALKAHGISIAEFEQYLHARHAEERNARMAELNPNQAELDKLILAAEADVHQAELDVQQATASGAGLGAAQRDLLRAEARLAHLKSAKPWSGTEDERQRLSGMSNAEAAQILKAIHQGSKPASFRALAKRVDALIDRTRDEMLGYGLESPDAVAAMRSTYQHYVPLHRDLNESDLLGSGSNGTGAGFSVRGSQVKAATGSLKQVEHIFANLVAQREQTIVRGEKNRVAKALYGMVLEHPNPDFWAVVSPAMSEKALRAELRGLGIDPATIDTMVKTPTVPAIDDKTGLAVRRVNPMYASMPNAIVLRVAGEDRVILFSPKEDRAVRLALALRNEDAETGSGRWWMEHVGPVTRWLAAVNTQYNPVFGLTNFTRDVQESALNITTTPIAGRQREMIGHLRSAAAGIWNWERGDRRHPWAKLYEEFRADGGETGYRDAYANIGDRAKALEKLLDGRPLRDAPGIRQVLDLLSDYNTMIENATRLSAYKTARDAGVSRPRAAALAKEITVNFNRKGARSGFASATFAFFNAAVQGVERNLRTLKGPAGRRILLGGFALGALQSALGFMLMGDAWDDIPEFERAKHLILPIPGESKKYVKIPLPLGFSAIPNITRSITDMLLFRDRTAQRVVDLVSATLDAFNPLGSGSPLAMITPTPLKPLAELRANKDGFGREIYREDRSDLDPTPGFTRAREGTGRLFKAAAEAANRLSGGDADVPGIWSPTPEELSYLFGAATGGLGREIDKAVNFIDAKVSGDAVPPYKTPLLSRFYGEAAGEAALRSKYYAALKEINTAENSLMGRAKRGDELGDALVLGGYGKAARKFEASIQALKKEKATEPDKARRKELDGEILSLEQSLVDLVAAAKEQAPSGGARP